MTFLTPNCVLVGRVLINFTRESTGQFFPRLYSTVWYPTSNVYSTTFNIHKFDGRQRRLNSSDRKNTEYLEDDEPIKFSTSKASTWSVDESFGKRHKKPNRMVIPISLAAMLFLAWAFLRKETEIDRQLEVGLEERLPGKFSEEDVEQFQPLPNWTKTLKEKAEKGNSQSRS